MKLVTLSAVEGIVNNQLKRQRHNGLFGQPFIKTVSLP